MIYHGKQLDGIISAKKDGSLKHSYLISGPAGVGKLQFAFRLAKISICETDNACGKCEGCVEIEKNFNPDLHVVESEGVIKIEQIRELRKNLSLKPYKHSKKIAVIPNIERITVEAANSLLKTLEEPSGETLLVLTTNNPQSLLPTIKSRCQEIKLGLVSAEVLTQMLSREFGLGEKDAKRIADLASGKPELAKAMSDPEFFDREFNFLKEILNSSMAVRFLKVKDLAENGDVLKTLNFWEVIFRSLLLEKTGSGSGESLGTDFAGLRVPKIINILDNLQKTKEYIESKINVKLALENLVLGL